MVKPLTGQAKFSEKVMRSISAFSSWGAVSSIAMPSAKSKAVLKLSAKRVAISSLIITRSTTTSILCRNFLSKIGGSSKS